MMQCYIVNRNSSHVKRVHLKGGRGGGSKDNSQGGEVDKGVNGQLQARAFNMAEKRSSQVPRYMHCDVCEVFMGIESFQEQIGGGGGKVCDQCRVEAEAKAKGLQGCLFPKFPKAP